MLLLSLLSSPLLAIDADSLRKFNIEEAVVVATPKETRQLRQQPVSVSLFDAEALTNRKVEAVKDISSLAPNFFMPNYGSRLTSACYIRGIGSRINTPAVGLYVDNVPYIDKSAYDFSFQGVERVDVMRGPQGTLYGRNTMGGLIRIFTANPITHRGTDVSVGIGTAAKSYATMTRHAAFTTYLHPAERMGLSVGGYYEGRDGYFKNAFNNKAQDGSEAGGGRLRWSWQPTNVVKMDWTASYEYSNEQACPYYLLGRTTDFVSYFNTATDKEALGTLEQNRPSSYRRSLFNTGLNVEHRMPRVVLTSITAFQHLSDRLFMDQDFTSNDIFSLCQKQKMYTLSEEVALKSPTANRRWTWTTGVFGMYQHLNTGCPVTFYDEGVAYLNHEVESHMPNSPKIDLAFTGSTIPFNADLQTPSVNAAIFHQSTVKLFAGLSATLGLRLDYDHRELSLRSGVEGTGVPYHFGMSMGPSMQFSTNLTADPTLNGALKHDTWQVLPKVALNYTLPRDLGNVYVSIAKGYRAGGYNIQSYSDLSRSLLQRNMMLGVKQYSVEAINNIAQLPEAVKQKAIAGMTGVLDMYTPAVPSLTTLYYKPEYTWSYEAGIHHNLADKMLQLDLSAFYMKTRDQQIARFAESGMGRVMVNAGRSRSVGIEVGVRSQLFDERLNLTANYGYTKAEFTNYDLGTSDGQRVDYTGNKVPFVPQHTFSAAVDYICPLAQGRYFVKSISMGADVKGAGRIEWNEANTFGQNFYATLGLHFGLTLAKQIDVSLYARNLTATHYATFAFDSMNNRFAQYAQPRTFGLNVKWHF